MEGIETVVDTNFSLLNFVHSLKDKRVGFTDDGVRKLICAMAYYEGVRFEVVKVKGKKVA